MRRVVRAIAGIAVITAIAAALLNMQARAFARALEQEALSGARAAAAVAGSEALMLAVADLEQGRIPAPQRRVDSDSGPLDVAVFLDRPDERRTGVRVEVADGQGRVLQTYETVVEK